MTVALRRTATTGIALMLAALSLPTPARPPAPETPGATSETAAVPESTATIDCVEVKLFAVAEEKVDGQTDRAEKIPGRNLEIIQAGVVKHLPKEARGVTAIAAGSGTCPNPATAATLAGDILDFRKGNMALRYLVGFGAGSQKVRVRLTLVRHDGSAIAQAEIADTKWGGAFGGTNTKGLDDFAEKAAEAAAKALKGH